MDKIKARVTYFKPAEVHVSFDMGRYHIERALKEEFMHLLHEQHLIYEDSTFYLVVDPDNPKNLSVEPYYEEYEEADPELFEKIIKDTCPEPLLKYELKLVELNRKKFELMGEVKKTLDEYREARINYEQSEMSKERKDL